MGAGDTGGSYLCLLPTSSIQECMNGSLESGAQIQVLSSVLPRCVALSKLLYLPEHQFFPSVI